MNTSTDTIVAPATASGGAIAVIRLSGPEAIACCDRIFRGRKPLAEAAGQTLGEVVSINASNSYGGDYGIANTYAMDARSAKTAIVSGDVTVSASVTVVFAIK